MKKFRIIVLLSLIVLLISIVAGLYLHSYHASLYSKINLNLSELKKVKNSLNNRNFQHADKEFLSYQRKKPKNFTIRYPEKGENVPELADKILNGIYIFNSHPPFHMPRDLVWETPDLGESTQYQLHSLIFLTNLVETYKSSGNKEYFKECLRIILDWIKENPSNEPPSKFSWGNHSTAERTLVFSYIWEEVRKTGKVDIQFMKSFLNSVYEHGKKLEGYPQFSKVQQQFWYPNHNHGLRQAMALLSLGVIFPEFKTSKEWQKIGKERIEQWVKVNISQKGVHLESSPSYHFFILKSLYEIKKFCKAYNINLCKEFHYKLRKMFDFAAFIIKPDLSLPMLGDTPKWNKEIIISLRKDLKEEKGEEKSEELEHYLYSSSGGRFGKPPKKTGVLFPKSRFAIMRSGWEQQETDSKDEIYSVLYAASYYRPHLQHDALNFILYSYGGDLIVDSGAYSYDNSQNRRYCISTRAHNTVVVDSENQRVTNPKYKGMRRLINSWKLKKLLKFLHLTKLKYFIKEYVVPPLTLLEKATNYNSCKILDWQTNGQFDYVEALNLSYKGVEHRRSILFIKPRYFIIIDNLISSSEHTYSLFFHLRPGLQISLDEYNVKTLNNNQWPNIEILPLEKVGLGINIIKGINDPLQGWISYRYKKIIPNIAIEYQKRGKEVKFITILYPEKPNADTNINAQILKDSDDELSIVFNHPEKQIVSIKKSSMPAKITVSTFTK